MNAPIANPDAMAEFSAAPCSVKITHPFSGTLIVTLNNSLHERLWLNRDQAMELLEQLPSAIAQIPVSISSNNAIPTSHAIEPQKKRIS
jgi:hypothetical protein